MVRSVLLQTTAFGKRQSSAPLPRNPCRRRLPGASTPGGEFVTSKRPEGLRRKGTVFRACPRRERPLPRPGSPRANESNVCATLQGQTKKLLRDSGNPCEETPTLLIAFLSQGVGVI